MFSSFENRNRILRYIAASSCPVVARRSLPQTKTVQCAFYLTDPEWLFGHQPNRLDYSLEFIEKAGGAYLSLPELRTPEDMRVAVQCMTDAMRVDDFLNVNMIWIQSTRRLFAHDTRFPFLRASETRSLKAGRSVDPTVAEELRTRGYLPLHEGKTFHQFHGYLGRCPRHLVALAARDGQAQMDKGQRSSTGQFIGTWLAQLTNAPLYSVSSRRGAVWTHCGRGTRT